MSPTLPPTNLRYLLLQIRDGHDPMLRQEVSCFARALGCPENRIQVCDLLNEQPSNQTLDVNDVVLIGGSGKYSAAGSGQWLDESLDLMRRLVSQSKPTFASCWGFQAMARALGGEVVTDPQRAELGALPLRLTPAGCQDPLFAGLPREFLALLGHEDIVTELPHEAIRLASSAGVANEAFVIRKKPIYGTQFHPELDRNSFLDRVRTYPEYVERIAGVTCEEFAGRCRDTPEASSLLKRFVALVMA